MNYIHNDGGRAVAGFKGDASDCVCRAIAIATGKDYGAVYRELWAFKDSLRQTKRIKDSHPRTGVSRKVYEKYLSNYGWEWHSTMAIGQGCKVHLKANELPKGTLIVRLSKHLTTVIDGVIHDTHDPSRDETRCVYGYFKRKCICPNGYHDMFVECRGY